MENLPIICKNCHIETSYELLTDGLCESCYMIMKCDIQGCENRRTYMYNKQPFQYCQKHKKQRIFKRRRFNYQLYDDLLNYIEQQ